MDREVGSNNNILIVSANRSNSLDYEPQHLYITSGEKIEVDDYVLSKLYGVGKVISDRWADSKGKTPMLVQFKDIAIMYGKDGSYKDDGNKMYLNDCYKVVATTDTSLWEYDDTVPYPKTRPALPQIPQSFIKQYVQAGGKIDKVEIKWDEFKDGNNIQVSCPKIDSNNCIINKPIKESWTREEVEAIIENYRLFSWKNGLTIQDKEKWIEQNL